MSNSSLLRASYSGGLKQRILETFMAENILAGELTSGSDPMLDA